MSDVLLYDGEIESAGGSVGVLTIGGVDYAANLLWNPVEQPSKAYEEARLLAVATHADLFVHRKRASQIGLGTVTLRHRANMPALAAELADQWGGSWIGAFQIDIYYYFISVKNGSIVSDAVYIGEADARDQLEALLFRTPNAIWERVYAPPSWRLADMIEDPEVDSLALPPLDERPLAALLIAKPTRVLRAFDVRQRQFKLAIAAAVAVLVILLGIKLFQSHLEALEAAQLEALRQARERALGPSEKQKMPPPPWAEHSFAADAIRDCLGAIDALSVNAPGWDAQSAQCSHPTLTVTFTRSGGTVNWVKPFVRLGGRPPDGLTPDGNKQMRATWRLRALKPQPVELAPPPLDQTKRYLTAVFEEKFHQMDFQAGPKNDWYETAQFKFSSFYSPIEFLGFLSSVQCLTISAVKYNYTDGLWVMEGQVYDILKHTS